MPIEVFEEAVYGSRLPSNGGRRYFGRGRSSGTADENGPKLPQDRERFVEEGLRYLDLALAINQEFDDAMTYRTPLSPSPTRQVRSRPKTELV
jgi:hypothetical protein